MLALIPARGGSKGLKDKNIKPLCGKPLIAHTIEQALASDKISRVIISTDSDPIAEVAMKYGAEVPFMRPAELAGDLSSAIDVFRYTLDRLEKSDGEIEDFVVLQATSPLRTSQDIDSAIEKFQQKDADSVISYTQEHHPIYWHKFIDEDGKFEDIFDLDIPTNRQEMKRQSYFPNGAIFVLKKDLLERGNYYTDKSYAYIMPRERSVDIDTLEDFDYAEFLMKKSHA